jgi:hypothetical protein
MGSHLPRAIAAGGMIRHRDTRLKNRMSRPSPVAANVPAKARPVVRPAQGKSAGFGLRRDRQAAAG